VTPSTTGRGGGPSESYSLNKERSWKFGGMGVKGLKSSKKGRGEGGKQLQQYIMAPGKEVMSS